MSDGDGSDGYGIGVWAMAGGLIVSVLAGIVLIALDGNLALLTADGRQLYAIVFLVFGVGVLVTVAGMLTAVGERTIDYLSS